MGLGDLEPLGLVLRASKCSPAKEAASEFSSLTTLALTLLLCLVALAGLVDYFFSPFLGDALGLLPLVGEALLSLPGDEVGLRWGEGLLLFLAGEASANPRVGFGGI